MTGFEDLQYPEVVARLHALTGTSVGSPSPWPELDHRIVRIRRRRQAGIAAAAAAAVSVGAIGAGVAIRRTPGPVSIGSAGASTPATTSGRSAPGHLCVRESSGATQSPSTDTSASKPSPGADAGEVFDYRLRLQGLVLHPEAAFRAVSHGFLLGVGGKPQDVSQALAAERDDSGTTVGMIASRVGDGPWKVLTYGSIYFPPHVMSYAANYGKLVTIPGAAATTDALFVAQQFRDNVAGSPYVVSSGTAKGQVCTPLYGSPPDSIVVLAPTGATQVSVNGVTADVIDRMAVVPGAAPLGTQVQALAVDGSVIASTKVLGSSGF